MHQLLFVLLFAPLVNGAKDPLLLVIAYDGMRYDYINQVRTPFLWNLTKNGVFAPNGIHNEFITLTAPNFYSLSTGLHIENHGIVGNYFYDPVYGQFWDYFNNSLNQEYVQNAYDPKWYSGEPIWQTGERQGRPAGVVRWPFGEVKINNRSAERCWPYLHDVDSLEFEHWKAEIDQLIDWYMDPKDPIKIGLYYNEKLDREQHLGDIYRERVTDIALQLDQLTAYLFRRLRETDLIGRMNVILTSDHGHVNTYRPFNMIKLEEFIERSHYIPSESSLFPRTDIGITTEQLYKELKRAAQRNPNFKVLLKQELPSDFHFKKSRRVGPIVLFEKLGYLVVMDAYGQKAMSDPAGGTHGYPHNYQEMRPFFTATGPGLKRKYQLSEASKLQTADLYNLMCHLAGLKPAKNDGIVANIADLLSGASRMEL